MVIDTSALAAILLQEPESGHFEHCIAEAPMRLLSAVNRVELSCVIESRKGAAGRAAVDMLLREAAIETVGATPHHAEIAIEAYRRFGKGRHRAGLNIGDCFAYALAKAVDDVLLFKGEDFVHTDIRPALPVERS